MVFRFIRWKKLPPRRRFPSLMPLRVRVQNTTAYMFPLGLFDHRKNFTSKAKIIFFQLTSAAKCGKKYPATRKILNWLKLILLSLPLQSTFEDFVNEDSKGRNEFAVKPYRTFGGYFALISIIFCLAFSPIPLYEPFSLSYVVRVATVTS